MQAVDFLRAVWPETGWHCIAVRVPIRDEPGKLVWKDTPFESIDAAAKYALEMGRKHDVYFNIHVLKQEKVWNEKLKDWKGNQGKWQIRTQDNMRGSRAYFCELDVGPTKPYQSQAEALHGLKAFCLSARFPKPTVVSSGTGIHVYWFLDREVHSLEWKVGAIKLRRIMDTHGLHYDEARITDQASVLRVPGTTHRKDPSNIRDVKVLAIGKPVAYNDFLALLEQSTTTPGAILEHKTAEEISQAGAFALPSADELAAVEKETYGTLLPTDPPKPQLVIDACAQARWLIRNQKTVSEPQWYHGLNLFRFVEGGRKFAHSISALYEGYTEEETDAKLDQLESVMIDSKPLGPTTCGKIAEVCGPKLCATCWYKGNPKSSPVVASRRIPKKAEPGMPEPPPPWTRLKEGGILYQEDGTLQPRIVIPYDFYPKAIIADKVENKLHFAWVAAVSNRETVEISVPAPTVYDQTKLGELLINNGMLLDFDEIKYVRKYMIAYVAQLQKKVKDLQQHNHLGWTKDFASFVTGEHEYFVDGRIEPAITSRNVKTTSQHLYSKGTLLEQRKLMQFYNRPEYMAQQFLIACSLATPFFYMTGQYGMIVNMTGKPGASKSTGLYAAASLWGAGEHYTINGNKDGATIHARNERVTTLSNIPLPVDEITLMKPEDARSLALNISQPGHRIRLYQNGEERKVEVTQKATMMLCTSNAPLHEMLSSGNVSGTAGSMRVFEIPCERTEIHTKFEADEFLRGMRNHFGWIGPEFLRLMVPHRDAIFKEIIDAMEEIDRIAMVRGAERFWSAVIAVVKVILTRAYRAGLLPFDPVHVIAWAINTQLRGMRATVDSSYATPTDTVMTYLNSIVGDMLVVREGAVANADVQIIKEPVRELAARYEPNRKIMYISLGHFKAWAMRSGVGHNATLAALEHAGVGKRTKVTLGRGTTRFLFGQVPAFQLDLSHEAISGMVQSLDAATNVVSIR